jgi:hypothetical protein
LLGGGLQQALDLAQVDGLPHHAQLGRHLDVGQQLGGGDTALLEFDLQIEGAGRG